MRIARIFVPFLNEVVDMWLFEQADSIPKWKVLIVNTKDPESKKEVIYYARFITVIENDKAKADDSYGFVRLATKTDLELIARLTEDEEKYFEEFKESAIGLWLDLIWVNCKLAFSQSAILFTYIAAERVDFRELLKVLATKIKKRIQLKHIWARDRASFTWWYWICWKEICCIAFLREIPTVKAESVKQQEYFHKWSENLSWICWKLKCCLNYEIEQYREMKKNMPEYWETFNINWEHATVVWIDIFNQKVKLRIWDKSSIVDINDINKAKKW